MHREKAHDDNERVMVPRRDLQRSEQSPEVRRATVSRICIMYQRPKEKIQKLLYTHTVQITNLMRSTSAWLGALILGLVCKVGIDWPELGLPELSKVSGV